MIEIGLANFLAYAIAAVLTIAAIVVTLAVVNDKKVFAERNIDIRIHGMIVGVWSAWSLTALPAWLVAFGVIVFR